ncbi:hypothetical protein DAI22_08g161000 [Oryza sativa Japonica Group]|nr:hypothetical protein DAI22_08g161000 [Oryza sativa Japonica Group]
MSASWPNSSKVLQAGDGGELGDIVGRASRTHRDREDVVVAGGSPPTPSQQAPCRWRRR